MENSRKGNLQKAMEHKVNLRKMIEKYKENYGTWKII